MKRLVLAFVLCTTLLFSGCSFLFIGMDELLEAPKFDKEQSQIYDALVKAIGEDISLVYPLKGEYRSAFVVEDMDMDGVSEALVFYKNKNDSTVRVNYLDKTEGNQWISVYDFLGEGTDVESLILTRLGDSYDIHIVIGYTSISTVNKTFCVYSYAFGRIDKKFKDSYVMLENADFDGDEKGELFVIRNDPDFQGRYIASFMEVSGDEVVNIDTIGMSSETERILSATVGKIMTSKNVIYVDSLKRNGNLQTEIFYYNPKNIVSSAERDEFFLSVTERINGYPSLDFDSDLSVEIPVPYVAPGYENREDSEKLYLTDWYAYENYSFVKRCSSYYNVKDKYVFKLPTRWQNFITVKIDDGTGEVVFVKNMQDISNSEELMRIVSTPKSTTQRYLHSGYVLLGSRGNVDYLVKLSRSNDEPLVLTMDEIINNFYVVH